MAFGDDVLTLTQNTHVAEAHVHGMYHLAAARAHANALITAAKIRSRADRAIADREAITREYMADQSVYGHLRGQQMAGESAERVARIQNEPKMQELGMIRGLYNRNEYAYHAISSNQATATGVDDTGAIQLDFGGNTLAQAEYNKNLAVAGKNPDQAATAFRQGVQKIRELEGVNNMPSVDRAIQNYEASTGTRLTDAQKMYYASTQSNPDAERARLEWIHENYSAAAKSGGAPSQPAVINKEFGPQVDIPPGMPGAEGATLPSIRKMAANFPLPATQMPGANLQAAQPPTANKTTMPGTSQATQPPALSRMFAASQTMPDTQTPTGLRGSLRELRPTQIPPSPNERVWQGIKSVPSTAISAVGRGASWLGQGFKELNRQGEETLRAEREAQRKREEERLASTRKKIGW